MLGEALSVSGVEGLGGSANATLQTIKFGEKALPVQDLTGGSGAAALDLCRTREAELCVADGAFIATVVASNLVLERLSLKGNRHLDDDVAKAFSEAIAKTARLTSLDLTDCGLNNKGKRALRDAAAARAKVAREATAAADPKRTSITRRTASLAKKERTASLQRGGRQRGVSRDAAAAPAAAAPTPPPAAAPAAAAPSKLASAAARKLALKSASAKAMASLLKKEGGGKKGGSEAAAAGGGGGALLRGLSIEAKEQAKGAARDKALPAVAETPILELLLDPDDEHEAASGRDSSDDDSWNDSSEEEEDEDEDEDEDEEHSSIEFEDEDSDVEAGTVPYGYKVENAGYEPANGLYVHGGSYQGAPLFTKGRLWLLRYQMPSGKHSWFIADKNNLDSDNARQTRARTPGSQISAPSAAHALRRAPCAGRLLQCQERVEAAARVRRVEPGKGWRGARARPREGQNRAVQGPPDSPALLARARLEERRAQAQQLRRVRRHGHGVPLRRRL